MIRLATDYEKIYQTDLTYVSDCWTLKNSEGSTCNSYCCTNFFPLTANLKFQRKHLQELYLLPGEYGFLQATGKLDPEFEKHYHKRRISINEEVFFEIESIQCGYKGKCHGELRPVICRLYPHFPEVDIKGCLVGVGKLNQYDEFLDLMKAPQVCTIMEQMSEEARKQFDEIVAELVKDPVKIFYLKAARIFRTNVLEHVQNNYAEYLQLAPSVFFERLEKLFVLRKAFDKEKTVEEILELYRGMKNHWGERFVLPSGA